MMQHTTELPTPPLTSHTAERCAICNTPLTPLDAPTRPTCRSAVCRWRYATMPAAEKCRVCKRPLAPAERLGGVCERAACRDARMREWREWRARRRVEDQALRAQAGALRAERAASLGIADADSYHVVLTPSYAGGGLVPVSRERRRKLREHLTRVATAALEQPTSSAAAAPPEPPLHPEVGRVLGAACATCQGHCCRNGTERGYLSADTIRRTFGGEPGLTVRKVVTRYLRRVGKTSQARSCIFHGAAGCTLPREMRSDTCNRYFCGELVHLRRSLETGEISRVFLATFSGPDGALTTAVRGDAFVAAAVDAPTAAE